MGVLLNGVIMNLMLWKKVTLQIEIKGSSNNFNTVQSYCCIQKEQLRFGRPDSSHSNEKQPP